MYVSYMYNPKHNYIFDKYVIRFNRRDDQISVWLAAQSLTEESS